jgi:SulP family sulfate permease
MVALAPYAKLIPLTTLAVSHVLDDDVNRKTGAPTQAPIYIPPEVAVFRMTGPFFFGVADDVKDAFDRIQRPLRIFILQMGLVSFVDATGLDALEQLIEKCRRHGVKFMLCEIQPRVVESLERSGIVGALGSDGIFSNIDDAIGAARRILSTEGASTRR